MTELLSTSRRIAHIQPPVIPEVGALLAAHPQAISLGQGVPSYGPPAALLTKAVVPQAEPARHRYQPGDGMPELLAIWRDVIAAENGIHATPGDMMITAGSNMAFLQLMAVIADPGDQVILPAPYFFNQRMALEMLGVEPVLVITDGAFQLDLERIVAAVTAKTRAIVTVSPNNPTGAVYSREALTAVNELCALRGLIHVSDEAYQHFVFDGASHFSPASLSGAEAHTITLFSMSKSYGIAGWRVGCALAPRRFMHDLRKVQDTNVICAPVPSQRLAAVLLAEGGQWRREQVARIGALRAPLIRALAAMDGLLETPTTEGAFYFMLRLPRSGPDMPLVARLIRDHGIALIPGSAFGTGPQMHLRLAYGALTPTSLDQAMDRLREGLYAGQ